MAHRRACTNHRPGLYPERLPEFEYARRDRRTPRADPMVRSAGGPTRSHLSQALAGECIALEEILEDRWCVRFGPVLLGWLDHAARRRPPGARAALRSNPHLLPMCPV